MFKSRMLQLTCLITLVLWPFSADAQVNHLCERLYSIWTDDNQYIHTYPVGGNAFGGSWSSTTQGQQIIQNTPLALGESNGTNSWTMAVSLVADALIPIGSTTAAPQCTAQSANQFTFNLAGFAWFSMFQEAISTAAFEVLPAESDPDAEECLLTAEFNLSVNQLGFPAGGSSIFLACADGNQNNDLDNWAWVEAFPEGGGGTRVDAYLPQADGPPIAFSTTVPGGIYSVTFTASKIVPVGHVFTLNARPVIAGGPFPIFGGAGYVNPYATGTVAAAITQAP